MGWNLPSSRADLEQAAFDSARARKIKRYRKYLCPSVSVFVILIVTITYMFFGSNNAESDFIEQNSLLNTLDKLEHPSHDRTDIVHTNPILTANVKIYHSEGDIPEEFWEPCRRISKEEWKYDLTIAGDKITDILMSMCRTLHDQVGCDGEGALPVKLLDVRPLLNVCIMTYKNRQGKCTHYINPTIRKIAEQADIPIALTPRYFTYVGKSLVKRQNQIMMTYQTTDKDDATYITEGFGGDQSINIQNAYDVLQGLFPKRHIPTSDTEK